MRVFLVRFFCLLFVLFLAGVSAFGQTAQLFFEDFDDTTPPALPAGWSDATGVWETSASVSSTGSGLNNLYIQGTAPASVTTPIVNLAGLTEGTISYLARRTSTYAQGSLTVLASTDGGATFPITVLAAGAALPLTDGSYQAISVAVPAALLGVSQVALRFEGAGGTSTGSNLRIDDFSITGLSEGNLFGFALATSTADAATGEVTIGLSLDFQNTASLQGLQFTLDWDVATVSFVDIIRGAAVSNAAQWQVSAEADGASARVVLLNGGAAGLAEGIYNPILSIRLRAEAGTVAAQTVLALSDVVSALAVPTGDDAGLGIGLGTHTVTLPVVGAAEFVPSATSFDLGTVAVGTTGQGVLTVTNPGGSSALVVSGVASSNPLFTVTPTIATVVPGGSQAFTIVFDPTELDFGAQATVLTFTHNAAAGTTNIAASAVGTGGRGDASGDGSVDAIDLVLGIDFVLDRVAPTAAQLASLDVFPFAAPDVLLDVRDLTVVAQAIVLGEWPDGALPPLEPAGGKQLAAAMGIFEIEPEAIPGGLLFLASHDEPVRAIQLSLRLEEANALVEVMMEEVARGEAFALVHRIEAARLVRVLIYRIDGKSFAPGSYPLLRVANVTSVTPATLRFGLAVGEHLERVPVRLLAYTATGIEEALPSASAVGAPYPNPFAAGDGRVLRVPVHLVSAGPLRVALYDVLGREVALLHEGNKAAGAHEVEWSGTDHGVPLAPGLYLVQARTGSGITARPLILR